jgi:hypothetical protein
MTQGRPASEPPDRFYDDPAAPTADRLVPSVNVIVNNGASNGEARQEF